MGLWLLYYVVFLSHPLARRFLLLGFPDSGLQVVLLLRGGPPGPVMLLACLWVSRSSLLVSGVGEAASAQERVQQKT